MRALNYKAEYQKLLTPELVSILMQIHELKAKNEYLVKKGRTFSALIEMAKIQSTEASNRIEGIVTTSERLEKLMKEKTMPKNRSEEEIAGYRDVLNTIHESYFFIPLKPNIILQLHRDLYKFSGSGIGGKFKNTDNVIAEELPDGTKFVRFQPVPAWETASAVDALCDAFQEASKDPSIDPLILIPMFILDFLCIHPFNDGNGRMSRLLTLLLLCQKGYDVGKFISIEKLIADNKELYYESLQQSSTSWHECQNDYMPFVLYMLTTIIVAYRELDERAKLAFAEGLSKTERVREVIRDKIGKISKAEIMQKCPGISQKTVERALAELLDEGKIIKIGDGRYTKYTWIWEKE